MTRDSMSAKTLQRERRGRERKQKKLDAEGKYCIHKEAERASEDMLPCRPAKTKQLFVCACLELNKRSQINVVHTHTIRFKLTHAQNCGKGHLKYEGFFLHTGLNMGSEVRDTRRKLPHSTVTSLFSLITSLTFSAPAPLLLLFPLPPLFLRPHLQAVSLGLHE